MIFFDKNLTLRSYFFKSYFLGNLLNTDKKRDDYFFLRSNCRLNILLYICNLKNY
jgi:hypothetical protein